MVNSISTQVNLPLVSQELWPALQLETIDKHVLTQDVCCDSIFCVI